MVLERISRLQEAIHEEPFDTLVITFPTDLHYLSGLTLSTGICFCTPDGATLHVDGRYYEEATKNCPFPVELVEQGTFPKPPGKRIGFDASHTTFHTYQKMLSSWGTELIPLPNPLQPFRAIKDSREQQLLAEAADLNCKGFEYLCTILKEGITEREVANALEIFWKQQGGNGLSFSPNISFGINSVFPHHYPDNTPLQQNNIILADIGVMVGSYHSDLTRCGFFGKADPMLLTIYDVVKHAQKAALDACRPGITGGELDRIARGIIAAKGYSDYYNHGLGHGVGLEIHEHPKIKDAEECAETILEEGMVITIEPGIYLPGLGGVRIEDTIVITKEVHSNLTWLTKEPITITSDDVKPLDILN